MILTKNILIEEYINRKRTSYDIAKDYLCHPCTIIFYLRKFGISIRTSGESQLGKSKPPRSKETIEKIRKGNLGQIRSQSTKIKLSLAKIGKKLSKETRNKMSIS